jgi:ABC-2 type transport system ATP-binding protein
MDIIEEHQQKGATVIFVTHQMEEVERLCDRILLLKDGRARAYGTVEDVKNEFGDSTIEVVSKQKIPEQPKLYDIQQTNGAITTLLPKANLLAIQQALAKAGIGFTRFETKRPSLDDIFVQIYGSAGQEEHRA